MFYTIADVASEFKVSTKTIQRMKDRGDLTIKYFGASVRISEEEMDRLRREGLPIHKYQTRNLSSSHPKTPKRRTEGRLWVTK